MQIQLNQAEIEVAVYEYIANQGIKVEGKALSLKFQMTRGEQGLVGEVAIEEAKPEVKAAGAKTSPKATVNTLPKPNTIGSAISKVGEDKPAPTTAAEAVKAAQESAATRAAAAEPEAPAPTEEGGEASAEEVKEGAATTTSLFG